MERMLGIAPKVETLEGLNGARLGYSQVLFVPSEALECEDRRDIVVSFLDATFQGWREAIRNPEDSTRIIDEAKLMLKLDDENNDHWHNSQSYNAEMLRL